MHRHKSQTYFATPLRRLGFGLLLLTAFNTAAQAQDDVEVSIVADNTSLANGSGGVDFRLELSAEAEQDIIVDYFVSGSAVGPDVVISPGRITIRAGTLSRVGGFAGALGRQNNSTMVASLRNGNGRANIQGPGFLGTQDAVIFTYGNDSRQPRVNLSATSGSAAEDGGIATYTVQLNTPPTSAVTITPTSDQLGTATVSTANDENTLTFTTSTWLTPQIITVTAVNDDIQNDPDRIATITTVAASSDTGYAGLTNNFAFTATDDEIDGLSFSTDAITVAEAGTATYTVRLNTQPSADVTVTPTRLGAAATVSPATLTFTMTNWDMPQTVTVTGVNDDNAINDTFNIIHTASGGGYGSITGNVGVTAIDDDVPGVILSTPTSLTVAEAGGTATYTVVLDTQPVGNFIVTPTSGDDMTATVSDALTFTDSNWDTPQTVTVTGVNDLIENTPNRTATISHGVSGGILATTFTFTVLDDDIPGVTLSATSGSALENGGTASYTVVLNTRPTNNVMISAIFFSFPNPAEFVPDSLAFSLNFTRDNWDTPQTVTVVAINDDIDNVSNRTATIIHGISGGGYSGVEIDRFIFTVIDDDGTAGVTLSATSGSAAEDGGEIEYTVLLDALPTDDVTITPTSGDDTTADVSGALTFTTANWFTPQTVTVTSVNDNIDNATDRTATISHAASGGGYGSVTVDAYTFTATDDDEPVLGLTFTPDSVTVDEAGSETYTVVLNTQPSADVTVTPTSGNTDAATVSPSTLTFTTSNFGTAQTVTVTGVNDDNGVSETFDITHAASGGGYGAVTGDVGVTTTDTDTDGLSFTPGSVSVGEDGGTASYTVVLDTEPSADVTVTPTSGNADAATVSGALTFTDSNWNIAQTVTVTGVNDDNGVSETFNITHAASGGGYGSVTGNVGVTTTDDDTAGLTFTPDSVTVAEAGTENYTVVLDTEPSGNVTVTPTSGNTNAASVSGALTFTTANWDTPQSVTVTGVDDANSASETFNITHAASGGGYGSITGSVGVTTTDDDIPGLTFTPGSVTVAEAGSQTYTVVLNTEPSAPVTVTPTSDNADAATVSPATLSFTDSNFGTPQTITVTGVNDDNGIDESFDIMHRAIGGGYGSVTGTVGVTTDDDDTADVTLSPASGNAAEDGGTATYTVVLDTEPGGNVTITPTSDDNTTATVSGALTFTTANWDTAQTITVTGVDDDIDNASNRTATISHTAASASDSDYEGITLDAYTFTANDDDTAAVNLSATSGNATEDGGTETYTVVLDTQPTGNVTITPTSGDDTTADVSAALTFTTTDWNTAQTITVTGVNDDIDNATDRTATISHTASGGGYGSVTVGDYIFTANDDDIPGLTFAPDSLTVAEAGSQTYTVVLDTQPSANVTVTPTSGNTAAASVSGALTFTDSNWNTAQTVTVTGVDDDNGIDETFDITHAASGGGYGSVTGSVGVTTDDDDTAGVTLSPTSGNATEDGGTASYTVVLDTEPSGNVTITPASGTLTTATVSDALTFTTANWDTEQTVTVTGVNDNNINASNRTATISHTASGYGSVTVGDYTFTATDDDIPGLRFSTNSLTVAEAGSETYTVRLNTAPSADVTVTPTSGNSDAATVSSALTFTDSNWDTPQTVTVTGVDDDNGTDETFNITHLLSSTDTDYSSVTGSVAVTTTDNDSAAVILLPTSGNATEDGGTAEYTVVLDTQPTASVTVTPTSGTLTTATVSGALTFTMTNWDTAQTITVTGVDDDIDNASNRTATISHAVSGGDYSGITVGDFTFTATDDDTAAVTLSPTGGSATEDGDTAIYNVVLGSEPTASVTVTPTSGDETTAIVSGALTFTMTNWDTAQTVTVTGVDDDIDNASNRTATISHAATSSDSDYSGITVGAYTFTATDDDTAAVTLSATSGNATEDDGTATYTVVLNTEPTGTVTITPASDASTTATVSGALTFTMTNWDTAQTVTVTGVDDAIDNASDRTATISHTASGGGYGSVTVGDYTFTATDDDTAAVILLPTSGNATEDDGTATYTVVLDTEPTGTVTITPTSGDETTATVSAALTFTASNFGTAQSVTVTGVDDDIVNASNRTATISHTASGGGYGSVTVDDYTFTTTDDDIPGLTLAPNSVTVAEADSETYTVVLNTEPSGEVTITPTSGNPAAATVSPATLSFTASNFGTAQTITVTGVDDDNGIDETFNITHAASGGGYGSVTGSVSVTTDDDDTAGVTLSPTSGNADENGDTAIYNVVLGSEPTASVTVTPTSGDETTAIVSGALTFTMTNWDTAQTVTVTGVDDDIDNASNRTATISHAATSSDSDYSGITVGAYTFTATDDDTAGLRFSTASLTVAEADSETYTVRLNTQPTSNVTVTPTSGSTAATVSGALTFTDRNWNTVQTITVTGVDDANGIDETFNITHTASGGGYDAVTGDVGVTTNDDDIPGLTFAPDSVTVGEAGSQTYTVVLDTQPSANVTVTPESGNTDAATVSPATLIFTDSDFGTAQTITVTGVDDDNGVSETFNITHAASGGGYDSVTGDVGVTTTDDDAPGLTFTPNSVSVAEAGSQTYTVVLNTEPSAPVTVTPTSDNADAATVSPATLSFTDSNFGTAQTITVTGVNDDNGIDESFDIMHRAIGGGYSSVTGTVGVTTDDDDTAGVTLSPTSGNAGEDGGTETYTVVLDTEPGGNVTITPSSDDNTTATVSGALTFTMANWNTAQSVTVTGVDDDIDSDRTATISHTASGGDYGSVTVDDYTFTATDDDTAGVTLLPTSGNATEDGGTATYTVVLDTEPTGNVTITPSSGDDTTATVSAALIFTDRNWDTPRTITVTGVDDAIVNATDRTATISHTASGGDYGSVTVDDYTFTANDDDIPGLTFTPDSVSVGEAGSETYTVVLDTQPSADVTVTPESGNTNAASVSGALTFTDSNWDTVQTVTVTGVDDGNSASETFNITHTASGGGYGSVTGSVGVTTEDDDAPGLSFTPDSVSVGEAGSVDYTVVLDTQPSGEVILFPTSGNADAATVRPTMLTFTTSNFGTAQTITVTGVDDGNGVSETLDIMHRAMGGGYDSVTGTVGVTTTDDDIAGVTVTPPMLTVAEAGSTTYTVVLDTEPSGDVTVTPTSGNTGAVTVSGALIFTTANWDRAQRVTVSGVDDADTLDETVTISHSVISSDSDYSGLTVDTVTVTTDDADSPNNVPTVASEIANQNVTVGNNITVNVSSTFTDSDNDALSYSVMSDDTAVATVSVTGNTVTVTGVAAGSTGISVTADDGNGGSISDTFSVSVTAAATNNAPTVVTEIANQNVTVGNRITVNVSSTFTDSDNDALSYSVMSDDTAVATVSVIGNTVTVTGVAAGSTTISVTASDPDGESVTDIFSVSVTAAATNNAPTVVTEIADQTVTVNAMTGMDVSTTFTDSDNDALTYSASSNNTNIATVTVSGSVVSVTGVAAGSTTISVTASDPDGESVTDIFSVSVTAAATNNAPTVVTEIADQTVTVNAMTGMDVSSTFTDSDNDALTYSASSDDTNIATVTVSGSVVSVTGVAAGSTTISVTASDPDGESVTDIFSVSVTAAATNNAPTVVTEIADQTVTVNAMTRMNVSTTFTDSDNDTLSYSASSNDTNIATVTVSGNTVTVTGVAVGRTTISVTASDPDGESVTDIFAVTVDTMPTNNAPTVVTEIANQTVTVNATTRMDVSTTFMDSDNDALTYSASSDNTNIATVTVSGSVVSVTGIAAGSTTISVTANDGNGGMVSDIFAVTTDAAIMDIGALNETVLPQVTLAIVRHTQGAVARRVGQIASGAGAAAKVLTIAGQSSLGAALSTHADAIKAGILSLKDLLGNSDFVLPLNAGSSGGPATRTAVSLWGSGEYRSLSDDDSGFDWDGDAFSATIGIDAHVDKQLLLGMAGSWNDVNVDYRQENQSNEGDYNLSLFSVHPYAGWTGKRLSWWLTGGYGYGELSIDDNTIGASSSDVALYSFGTGLNGVLWTGNISTLRLKGDFLWAEMDVEGGDEITPYTTDVNSSRLLLEASQVHILGGVVSLEPSLEAGVRYDGGDGGNRTHMELGAGLRLRSNRLTLDGLAYALVGGDDFEDWNIREWGVRGLLHLQRGRHDQGLSFSLSPGYGVPERDAEALLWNDDTNNLGNGRGDYSNDGMRLDSELGYGILLRDQETLTPYGQMTLGGGSKRYLLGLRWSRTGLFELDLGGEHRRQDSQENGQGDNEDDVNNRILLQGQLNF